MTNEILDNMEKSYNEKLEENYQAILKGKVKRLTDDELKEFLLADTWFPWGQHAAGLAASILHRST